MALIIDLKVMPQSGRQELVLDKAGILKCFVTAAPEDGKANKEVVALVAEKLKLKKQQVEIISGLTSRKKRLAIDSCITYPQLLELLGLEHQGSLFGSK